MAVHTARAALPSAQTQAAQATLSAADQASRLVSEYAALKDGAEGAAGATEKHRRARFARKSSPA